MAEKALDVSYGTSPKERLDIYMPGDPNTTTGAPVLVMVHGGAWMIGSKGNDAVVLNKVDHYLPKGYVFVSVDYPMDPPDPLKEAESVAKAIAFVQRHIRAYGGDPERIVVMGHSAGAHLVSLVTADPAIGKAYGLQPWLGTVALDSAALDVSAIMGTDHARFYDQVFGSDPAYWAQASPSQRLQGAPVPMMMVCSSQRKESCAQTQAFVAKVTQAGGRAEPYPVDLSHGQINAELGRPGAYTDAVDAFLRSIGMP